MQAPNFNTLKFGHTKMNLELLPDEALTLILYRLNWATMKSMFNLHTRFRSICKLNAFWKHKFTYDFPNFLMEQELETCLGSRILYILKFEHQLILNNKNALLNVIKNNVDEENNCNEENGSNHETPKIDPRFFCCSNQFDTNNTLVEALSKDLKLTKLQTDDIAIHVLSMNSKRNDILNFLNTI